MKILISKKKYDRYLAKYLEEVPELTDDQEKENLRAHREYMDNDFVYYTPPHQRVSFEFWLSEHLNIPLGSLDNITIRI